MFVHEIEVYVGHFTIFANGSKYVNSAEIHILPFMQTGLLV